MASITKILILITAITAISGKALDINIDTDRPSARVSHRDELLDTLKIVAPEHDELDFIWPLWTKLDVLTPSLKADTTNTKSIVSQHGNRRERRQASGDGLDSILSLLPLNVPRFPNGDIVNYSTINMGVMKWIRGRLMSEIMNRITKSMSKTENVERP